jgi:hypothetical protein
VLGNYGPVDGAQPATDEAGFAGSASFTWTITSNVTVPRPALRAHARSDWALATIV